MVDWGVILACMIEGGLCEDVSFKIRSELKEHISYERTGGWTFQEGEKPGKRSLTWR